MSLVIRSPYRWWVFLAAIAGAMLASLDAFALRSAGTHEPVAASVTCCGACGVSPTRGANLDKARLAAALWQAAQTYMGPCAGRRPTDHKTDRCTAGHPCHDGRETLLGCVWTHRVTCGTRFDRRSTLRPGKRFRLSFDAEDWEDRIDEDDDSELPVKSCKCDLGRLTVDLPFHQIASLFPSTDIPPTASLPLTHLRC